MPLELKPHDTVNDIGAGPFTLAASLWISRPELRDIPLEFRCLDRTLAVLEAGKKFFSALAPACPWAIRTIRGEIRRSGPRHGGTLSVKIEGKPAALSAVVNVYNELFWDFSPLDDDRLERFTEQQARLLSSLTESSGSILVVEPGIPRSGEFISHLRASLMAKGRLPVSPCTHCAPCPLPGRQGTVSHKGRGKAKWCHFAFDTEDAPEELHKLSAASRLPKERAVLSFIFAGPVSDKTQNSKKEKQKTEKIRIISDSFPLRDKNTWGHDGCCEQGLVLVTGSRESLELSSSGALEELPLTKEKDAKSGAFIAVNL
jgi:hypothetical protein